MVTIIALGTVIQNVIWQLDRTLRRIILLLFFFCSKTKHFTHFNMVGIDPNCLMNKTIFPLPAAQDHFSYSSKQSGAWDKINRFTHCALKLETELQVSIDKNKKQANKHCMQYVNNACMLLWHHTGSALYPRLQAGNFGVGFTLQSFVVFTLVFSLLCVEVTSIILILIPIIITISPIAY